MVRTHGLTHIALAVRDVDSSLAFYRTVFGVREIFRHGGRVQAQTPGTKDILSFEKRDEAGAPGGIVHFGFRLVDPADIDRAIDDAVLGGGRVLRRGELKPGFPYAYLEDPDGYEVDWFE